MTKKKQEVWNIIAKAFIADKYEVGDNLQIVGKMPANRNDLVVLMIKQHHCGRPPQDSTEARRRKKEVER